MNNLQACLAKNMKLYRKKEGLSQVALAEKAGTAPNYIALIEVGKSFPSLTMLEKIASALKVDALDLFDKQGLSLVNQEMLQERLINSITAIIKDNISGCALLAKVPCD